MGKCKDANDASFWGAFGKNMLGCLGIPASVLPNSKYENRMQTLSQLKSKLQGITDVMGLQWVQHAQQLEQEYLTYIQDSNALLYENMQYNDMIMRNEIALEQIEIYAIYILFFFIYLYLLYL